MRSVAALLVLLGFVVSPASGAVLCVKKSGAVMLRDLACGAKEARLDPEQYGLRGPQGPPGDPGPGGPPGEPATAWWGYVNIDGSFGYGVGLVASKRTGNGLYEVTFDRPVQNCAYQATLANGGGEIWAAASASDAGTIMVSTRRSNGGASSAPFFVSMFCP